MDEAKARNLARFRVGEENFMGKTMGPEEIKLRREYVKNMLQNNAAWQGMTDQELNNVRIYRIYEDWYIEDKDFYEYNF